MSLKIIAYLLTLSLLVGCSTEKNEEPPAVVIPVLATRPVVKDMPVYLESIGQLRASVTAEIRPRVSGPIVGINVQEGEWVKEGAPLMQIDPSPYVIKVQEARAKLNLDMAALNAAQRKVERYQSLADKDLISKTEWDELETAVEKAAALVEADQAGISRAEMDLSFCHVYACVDGRIGRLDAHAGGLVSNSQSSPLVTISKQNPLYVEFMLTEKDAEKITEETQSLDVISLYTAEVMGSGKITYIDNHYDSRSGQILFRGLVDNTPAKLRPGQTVKVRVLVNTLPHALFIPQKAVKYNQEGAYLYVIGVDHTVSMRQVELGMTHDTQVMINKGLEVEEQVVTDGHLRLYPGIKVDVRE